jgi:hypothetical protein
MVFINAYTPKYKPLATKLIKSLDNLGLKHDVVEYESMGSWVQNCLYKAEFISVKQKEHGKVVWLDADCLVLKPPELFNTITEDIAYHLFKNKELLSGTLFFNNTEGAKNLLDAWVKLNNTKNNVWDQKNLQEVVRELKPSHYLLPPEYCFIFDSSKKYYGNLDPVIEHYQASRKFK